MSRVIDMISKQPQSLGRPIQAIQSNSNGGFSSVLDTFNNAFSKIYENVPWSTVGILIFSYFILHKMMPGGLFIAFFFPIF